MKKVALIIVNYNGKNYLSDLLESIFNFKPESVSQEVIIIDNNSNDGSADSAKQKYPEIILLKQEINLGFAAGNNVGLNYALDNNFDYVFLINQDTVVTEGYLDKLIETSESEKSIAAVQPKILLHPETSLINSVGNVIHYLGFGYTKGHKELNASFNKFNKEVNYCSGAAVLIKTEVLRLSGLFNEKYFMYHEDLDLGWRFSLLGYKNMVEPSSVVYHKYEFSRSIKKYYYMERNRYLTIFSNYKFLTILLILPALALMEIGLFLFSIINGFYEEKIKVYSYFLKKKNWQELAIQRKKIQKQRVKTDREVIKLFSGQILHQEIKNPIVDFIANPFLEVYWFLIKFLIIW